MRHLSLFFPVAVFMAMSTCLTAQELDGATYPVADVDSALSTRLTPKFEAAYYIEQGVKYFRESLKTLLLF